MHSNDEFAIPSSFNPARRGAVYFGRGGPAARAGGGGGLPSVEVARAGGEGGLPRISTDLDGVGFQRGSVFMLGE